MRIWLFAILLVLWGNLLHPLIGSTAILPGGSWPFVVAGAALVVVSLFAARALGLDAATLGLRPAGAFRGAFVATSAVAIMRGIVPALIGQPVIYEPLSRVAAGDLSTHIAFFLPFGAVIPEEFAFRGTLLGGLLARYGVRTAVLASAAAFALLFVGGVIMAGLRVTTGSLLTTIAAHWAFNAIILVGLRYQRID